MSLPHISPAKAKELIDRGAILVDIREFDEHARSRIPAARHAPLSRLERLEIGTEAPAVIFHCRSGNRTASNAARLAQSTAYDAFILDGGIDAWKAAGLPVTENKGQPIEIMRQVQIAAGSLAFAGVALGTYVHPGFYALSALVGAGLVFAGVSGSCMMARLLSFAPWNRRAATSAAA
ncbi:MAG: rhodanese family protein [bacterium]|nr:rhodanese family protein [bacterium]